MLSVIAVVFALAGCTAKDVENTLYYAVQATLNAFCTDRSNCERSCADGSGPGPSGCVPN